MNHFYLSLVFILHGNFTFKTIISPSDPEYDSEKLEKFFQKLMDQKTFR